MYRELLESIDTIAVKSYSDDYDPYQAVMDLMRIHELVIDASNTVKFISSFDMAVLDSIELLKEKGLIDNH